MKIIDCFGNTDEGSVVLDLLLLPKRFDKFIPFEYEFYLEIVNNIKTANKTLKQVMEEIDSELFKNK